MQPSESLHQRRGLARKCTAIFAAILLATSFCVAQTAAPTPPEVAWAQGLQKDPALLTEFGRLLTRLKTEVQLPPPRNESRLLPLQQDSTVFYLAMPNYGDALHQALTIFQQELQRSADLRAWWQRGELASNGPKVLDGLEKFYQLSQFPGDEITAAVATEGRQGPSLLILSEVKKTGLKDFLQQMATYLAGKSKPSFHVFDVQQLTAAKEMFPPQQPVILVRPNLVVGTLDLGELKRLNIHLDGSNQQFVSSPFGQRVAQVYEGGATLMGALDLQKILKQVPRGTGEKEMAFRRSGFADVKYVVWEHKGSSFESSSQMELSFTGPRHGIAAWLGSPGPLGSLEFVSSKAVFAATVRLQNPPQMFADIRDLSAASNPQAFARIAQMEQALKLSLKDDLLGLLGGEVTLETDSFQQSDPVWKAIIQVNNPERLQATLNTLLALFSAKPQQSEEGGITYHTLRIPSAQKTTEIGYAFVDGYMVIASSRDAVAEAVRLHRSGESLAKSRAFLAALPPGHGTDASALFYQDPAAMVAMNLRRIMPEMAESLSRTNAQTPAAVVCAYAEESKIREVSRGGGVDAGVVLVGAAIAIPNLLRARIAANESSAVAAIRTANTAQVMYSNAYPQRGFAPDLATLGPDPNSLTSASAHHANLIDSILGAASCTAGAWCTKAGFNFSLTALCHEQDCDQYVMVATPVSNNTGSRSFCSTSEGVIRVKPGPPLTSAVSVEECESWSQLQ